MSEDSEDAAKPEAAEPSGSFVQSISQAAAELYNQQTRPNFKVPAVLQSATSTVGDVAAAAWGGLSRWLGQPAAVDHSVAAESPEELDSEPIQAEQIDLST